MADKKISQLPVATQIDDADVIPVVQSNTTKQIDASFFLKKDSAGEFTTDDKVNIEGTGTALTVPNGTIDADTILVDGDTNNVITAEHAKLDKFGIATNRSEMYITNQNATGKMHFGNNGAHGTNKNLTIDKDGNVGVGVSTINGKLQVRQDNDAITGGIRIDRSSGSESSFLWMDSNSKLRLDNASNSSRNIIFNGDGSGKVGIGTDSPSARLHVIGSELRVENTTNSDGYIRFMNSSGQMSVGMAGTASNDLLVYDRKNSHNAAIYKGDDNKWGFFTDNTERLHINEVGNVGIGTTSPSGRLHVTSSSTTDAGGVIVESSNAGKFTYQYFDSSDNYIIKNGATAFRDICFNPGGTGSIGIGTDNPSSGKLVVQQSSDSITSGLTVRNANNQSSFFWMDNSNKMRIDNGSTSSRDFIFNGAGAGKVGVGTDSPDTALHVSSSDVFVAKFTRNAVGASVLTIDDQNSDGGMLMGLAGGGLALATSISGTLGEKMRIISNGNVGIGVVAPSEKLEVNGKIKATDINFTGLGTYSSNSVAVSAGLSTGDVYKDAGGFLKIVS